MPSSSRYGARSATSSNRSAAPNCNRYVAWRDRPIAALTCCSRTPTSTTRQSRHARPQPPNAGTTVKNVPGPARHARQTRMKGPMRPPRDLRDQDIASAVPAAGTALGAMPSALGASPGAGDPHGWEAPGDLEEPGGVQSQDLRLVRFPEEGGAPDEPARIVPAHVVGIVGADHDVIGAPQVHEVTKLLAIEHDRVEVELGERLARRLLEDLACVDPRPPHV